MKIANRILNVLLVLTGSILTLVFMFSSSGFFRSLMQLIHALPGKPDTYTLSVLITKCVLGLLCIFASFLLIRWGIKRMEKSSRKN